MALLESSAQHLSLLAMMACLWAPPHSTQPSPDRVAAAVVGNMGDAAMVCLSAAPRHAGPTACQWPAALLAAQEHASSLCPHAKCSCTGNVHTMIDMSILSSS